MTSGGVSDQAIPPILMVRLRPRQPNGPVVGETRRVCHLVPVPNSADVPDVLRAYCGEAIVPGTAELLNGIAGMPCEPCLAKSPVPAFAMLRSLPIGTDETMTELGRARRDVAEWWDLRLQPEQKIAARFVLLLLLQDPGRPMSVAEIAQRLEQDPYTVNLIMLLHSAIGWIQRTPDRTGWADQLYRLTERGAALARHHLAAGLTPTFATLATGLGLDITVVSELDTPDPGGCSTPPAAPTGHHPDQEN